MVLFLLTACATRPPPAPALLPTPPRPIVALDAWRGQAPALVLTALGTPALDKREGLARLLQFRTAACVLDLYFYPAPVESGSPTAETPLALRYWEARNRAGLTTPAQECLRTFYD